MAPSPKGLVLDLLSTVRTGSMPVRALVAAGGLFGIDENRLRVALTRLLAERLVERDQRGAYRLQRSRGVSALVTGATRGIGRAVAVEVGIDEQLLAVARPRAVVGLLF